MYCTKCGKENVDNARFCTGCGVKLTDGSGRTGKLVRTVAAVTAALVLVILVGAFAAAAACSREEGIEPEWDNSPAWSRQTAAQSVPGRQTVSAPPQAASGEPTLPPAEFKAEYVDIVNANRGRPWYLESDSSGYPSRLISHDTCYEVTNGRIYAAVIYDLGIMKDKKIGDHLQIHDTVYLITDIVVTKNGEYVYFDYVSGPDHDYWSLRRDLKDNFYTLAGEDAVTEKELLYTGSLYFSKDCKASAFDPENNFERHPVTFQDYATLPSHIVGAEHGLKADGGLRLWGDFEMDSFGLITSYDEYFVP